MNQTKAQIETHEALAVINESGSIFKITYLDDAHSNSNCHGDIALRGQSKIMAQSDSLDGTKAEQGALIKVIIGSKQDRRMGKLDGCVLGFRKA